jgi:protoporphyrin/coproporphyrin ferrochelatase
MRTAIILANVGTPEAPEVRKVYTYLTQFLNDPRVIDIPWLLRKLLVNLIIIPFRVRNSTKLYKMLWTEKGSPLLYLTESLATKLEARLGKNHKVFVAMRYGKPALKDVIQQIQKGKYDEVVIVPMFPQYASSTTGTATDEILKQISKWNVIPSIRFMGQFYDHPAYLEAFMKQVSKYNLSDYDHFIFSYHGLPDRHVNKVHPTISVQNCNCEVTMPEHGAYCYKATCYETTRLLAKRLQIEKDQYTVAFQSRLDKNWLTPFSDKVIVDLAKSGKKKMLVFAPSFVTDCLETIIEIGVEYEELFKENGGEILHLAEALNDANVWAEGLKEMILSNPEDIHLQPIK